MFTHKLWLLAVPTAFIALNGCGGGSGLTTPTPTTAPVVRDNIGRFSNVAPTDGANNVISSDFTESNRGFDSTSSLFVLQDENIGGDDGRRRRFSFDVDDRGFAAGRSYNLAPGGGGSSEVATSTYSQLFASDGNFQVWRAVSGTLVVDSVTPDSGIPIEVVAFRIVNARYQPVALTGPDIDQNRRPQGTFTFNYSGTVVRETS